MNPASLASAFRRVWTIALAFVVVSIVYAAPLVEPGAIKPGITAALAEKKAETRLKKLSELGSKLSLTEIPQALDVAADLGELRERAVLREAIVKRWSELSPLAALDYVNRQPESRNKLELVRVVALACAKENAATAAAAVVAMKTGRAAVEATGIVAEVWAKSDVRAALAWTRALPPGAAQEAALYTIRFIWVHSDPESAAGDVQTLPAGDTKNALLLNIAGEWAARDPQKAIAWARGLADPNEQQNVLAIIAESWADAHPAEAAAFARQLPFEFRAHATLAVLTRWATQNPAEAATWAIRLPEDVRQPGLTEVMNVWTAVEPAAAAAWVEKVEPASRDLVRQAYAEAVVEWAPESAVKMLLATADPALRWQRVGNLLARWSESDATAARAWLAAAVDIPTEAKQEWLAVHGGKGPGSP